MTALALGAAALAASPAPAAGATPSLALVDPGTPAHLESRNGRVFLDLGVFVASTRGAFELRVARPDYDSPVEITQVDADTGAILRELPETIRRRWLGLRHFFELTVRTPSGKVVADRRFRFCPNSGDLRPTDRDAEAPTYPDACQSTLPFVRGMVWGLDAGWSVSALGYLAEYRRRHDAVQLPEGEYTATVRIAPLYRSLFEIPPEQAEVVVDFTVEPISRRPATARRVARTIAGAPPPTLPHPAPDVLPDLVALPAWDLELIRSPGGKDLVSFAASPWNAGPGPLVIEGFRRRGTDSMDAFQYFYESDGAVLGRTPAGSMAFDSRQGHHHWHFVQFSRYSLIDSERGTVIRSRKQSFCLAPTDAIDLTVPGAAWRPWSATYSSVCGGKSAKWLRQAMPAGWADTYYQVVAGQAFNITNLRNGRYTIEIEVNPLGLIHERTTANNIARRRIVLSGTKRNRRLTVLPWHGITS